MCVLMLLVFGVSSIFSMPMESTPEMNMPIFMVRTSYTGASPEEVDKMVTDVIENALSTVSDISTMTSRSSEGSSMTNLQFDYSVDMDEKKTEIEDALNRVRLPDSADDPVIMEMSMDSSSVMNLSIQADSNSNIMAYVEDTVVPELEKISGVASVSTSGGSREYIQILLREEAMNQYGLSMTDVSNAIASADFTITAGDINRGDTTLSLQGGESLNTYQDIEDIPISLASGDIIHVSDVASVSKEKQTTSSISRYNGMENIGISISKNQSANTIEVCNAVVKTVDELNAAGLGLAIVVSNNSGETIYENIMAVVSSLVQGLVISMFVLLLFLGDWRAALIVAISMPMSVFAALVLMGMFGMTINLMSLGGLVVGVGMMVDNSIVVMESCFRSRNELTSFEQSAIDGANLVNSSVIASTITTIVVFLPIALMNGMSGQLFRDVGFTIVFSITASLISALTLVPLLFVKLHPIEKIESVTNKVLHCIETGYAKLLSGALNHKIIVVLIAVMLLISTFMMFTKLDMTLMPNMDQGAVSVSITTKTGLNLDATNAIITEVESIVAAQDEVDSYSLSSRGGGSASMSIYLKDTGNTDAYVDKLRTATQDIEDCSIEVSQQSGMSFGGGGGAEIELSGPNLAELQSLAEEVRQLMLAQEGVASASTSLSDGSPRAVIVVDPVSAAAIGTTPSQVLSTVKNMISGIEATTIQEGDQEYSVNVMYPEDRFHDVADLSGLMLTAKSGGQVPLTDVSTITYSNSPSQIERSDGDYVVSVSAQLASNVSSTQFTNKMIQELESMNLPDGVSLSGGSSMRTMNDEFSAIAGALCTAIFLVFVVMAIQFESMRFSLVVLLSVPFSMTGAFLALLITGNSISMTSLIGLVMLVGIVVNNAIVLIDYTAVLRETQNLSAKDALITSGRTRLRPILMTTMTTILSLIPMAAGIGGKVEMMQAMAVVVIGGLSVSTLLTLILIPTVYLLFDKQTRAQNRAKKGKPPRSKPPKHDRRSDYANQPVLPEEFR